MEPIKQSENQAIIDFTTEHGDATEFEVKDPNDEQANKVPFLVVPKGLSVQSVKKLIDEFRTKPERRRGQATLATQASFVEHVKRFASTDTVIFADVLLAEPSLLAVYDYNPAGGEVTAAAFGTHRARYPFPVSDEWDAWCEKENEPMEAITFAQFLEDRLADVASVEDLENPLPVREIGALFGGTFASAARLLELSRSLEVNVSATVQQAITLSSGEINVRYAEIHSDGAGEPIKVPNLFVIAIPVFVGDAKYPIVCRLRYRPQGQKVVWWYSMHRAKACFDDAVKLAVDAVQEATSRPVLYGAPEV